MEDIIIELKNQGKSHKEISEILKCAKSTVSYHCKKNKLNINNKLSDELIDNIQKMYINFTKINDISTILKISRSSVIKYIKNIDRQKSINELSRKERVSINVKNKRKELKIRSIEYKGGKCCKCGYKKCISALEFHHMDPKEKDFGISNKGYTRSWNIIKEELDKCILVCANCHREIHENINLGI